MPTPLRPVSKTLKQASAKRERRRGDEESTRAALGRTVARFAKMYGNSKLALMQALDGSQSDQEERRRRDPSTPTDDEVLLQYLTDHCPTLGSMVDEALSMRNPVKELNKLASDIDEGWSEARNTDTASLKKGLAANFNLDSDYDEHGHWVPPLNLTKRHLWGPNHPQLFPLVVPACEPPLNDDELETLKQPGATVLPTLWYDWMWKDRKHDPKNLDAGFLQGDLLVKAFLWIYFGAVINPTSSKLAAARKVGFTSVTVHSIAYTATLLRFALSCELRIDQNFNSAGFYEHLVQYLEHEDQHELTPEILNWWNRNVFPGGVAKASTSEPSTSETWQLAIKQRAERKAAAALRQQQQERGANATAAAAIIPTPIATPRPPLDDTTNGPMPRLPSRPSTSHSALSLDPWADQNGDLCNSTAEPDADRPAKKTKRIPPTRVQESDHESDIDGDEVQEETEMMGAAQRKQKPAKAGRKPRAPDARRSSRKATRKAA
ncbi:hypothetical protein FRC00_009413 [Tulasnella sp. 408]|nr:hypothetical protein FRC00_009413 [Tulasnella sp. 408]